jgi:Ser/Thr protein kinase RdoA (MazF antagonist)
MQHFPVISSVLAVDHVVSFIQQKYQVGSAATCRLLKTFVNDTYLITGNTEQYIFRIYTRNWRSLQEIEAEIQLIGTLRQNNISVSYPIADQNGRYVQSLPAPEGERWGVLFSFAPGRKIMQPSPELHESIGVTMANMHRITGNLSLNRVHYTPQVLLMDSFEKFRSYLPVGSEEFPYMTNLQQNLLREMTTVDMAGIRQGAVHLDIWADNLHIDEAGKMTLFDFDFCGNGWLCYDIAFYLLLLHSMETPEVYHIKKTRFLQGYESVTPISPEEKRLLKTIGASVYCFYLGVQRERFATIFFNEEHLRRHIRHRMMRWMDQPDA